MGLDNNIHSFTENTTKKIAKFDGKFTQGNAVYHADNIACALMAQPVGNMGGYSSLYLVEIDAEWKVYNPYVKENHGAVTAVIEIEFPCYISNDMYWHIVGYVIL